MYLGLGTAVLSDSQVPGLPGPRALGAAAEVRRLQSLEGEGSGGREARLSLGGVLSEWVWGPVLEVGGVLSWKRSVSLPWAPTSSPLPPCPGCLRFPRKTRRPGNRRGRSDRSPPPPAAPRRPHRDRPTHLKGPWLPGLPPPADSPHTCGRTIYNSAPIPGLWAGAGCD